MRSSLSFGTVGALQKRLDAGETADVVISAIPAIDRLDKAGALVPGSKTALATTRIGVAVRDGTAAPDISTPEAFKQTLVAARAIAFSDAAVGGSAGVHLARPVRGPGAGGRHQAERHAAADRRRGGDAGRRGQADIGMTLIAEIVPIRGARVIGPLPAPLRNDTTYWAAVMAPCAAPDAARAFIKALSRPDTRETWKAAGFEAAN